MSSVRMSGEPPRELLSALLDGEVDPREADAACEAWRATDAAKDCWHEYQLIGDVLRSEDLAQSADHDTAFLKRLRVELAKQPVVLAPDLSSAASPSGPVRHAPSAVIAARSARWNWLAPSAVAAGVLAITGSWMLVRQSPDADGTAVVAVQRPVVQQTVNGAVSQASLELAAPASAVMPALSELPGGGTLVRDAQLDRYLAAHKQFSSSSVLGAPSGALRQVATDAAER